MPTSSGDGPNSITTNLVFSVSQDASVPLDWSSSAPLIIQTNGTVYRPREAGCFRSGTQSLCTHYEETFKQVLVRLRGIINSEDDEFMRCNCHKRAVPNRPEYS
ncbi:MAG: immunoglobulin-like domain-containing protein [Kiritimatiellales bacterium]